MHPLSSRSLESIIKTKLVDNEEKEYEDEYGKVLANGWDISYVTIDDENWSSSMSSVSMQTSSSQGSFGSLLSMENAEEGDEENYGGVFSMDM